MVDRKLHSFAEQEEEEDEFELRPFYYYVQPITHPIHHYYISGPIGDPHQYVGLVHRLLTASPGEVVYLHLNTPGGNMTTGVQIINAMRQSKAHVIAAAESEVLSLGPLVFLAADEWVVHDNCLFMFHNYSSGIWGKGNEQKASLDANIKWYQDLARTLLLPFLTDEELRRIMVGEDIYMHSSDVRQRLTKMVRQLKKEQKETLKDQPDKPAPKRVRTKRPPVETDTST